MSDLSFSPSPEPSSRKRKSKSSSSTQANKKPRGRGRGKQSALDPYETAKCYMQPVLASPKTFHLPEDVQEEALRIRNLMNRGIKKMMCWKSTCADGRAKYAFEGVCPDPRVFGTVFGLDEPPAWVIKKYTFAEFEEFVGHVRGEVRYAYLYLTSDVRVEYKSGTGEFTASGKYGKKK
ncbi:hypothetical protein OPQ81_011254 [Rhizoctonia solani]|nr:hypothetical protein OPQ81_011254 [Rhizoctonia solani]